MPVAAIKTDDTFRHDLKTCEGGFVVLKRLSYGQWLARNEMAMEVKIQASGRGNNAAFGGEMAMHNRKVTIWEFQQCIVDHNLQNTDETPLDFRGINTLDILDPKVGTEISDYIRELHDFETDLPN